MHCCEPYRRKPTTRGDSPGLYINVYIKSLTTQGSSKSTQYHNEDKMTVVPVESKVPAHPRLHSSGSLDGFKSTTLTPVIGQEFPKDSVNIVDDILNASNAEQRIRDLAILSMSIPMIAQEGTNILQSPNAASSSSAPRITSPTTSRNNSSSNWANSPADPQTTAYTSTPSSTTPGNSATQTRKSALSTRSSTRSCTRARMATSLQSGTRISPLKRRRRTSRL